ncbi:hypothetical protein SAMN05216257_104107 [Meinhardsimonia xiamenensis]|jgi:hypothetical protein|uniref:Methyltransferase n=2 Tax=Meinhardsimonia xiamenensis TaxID=990712 RepID=A0A1G9E130_9RHOB|nr:hypothetical protein LV81_02407 [Meinhardsimonia xiamenensis]SDK69827.1 hypothetical protein SAMN05216257_104107 [Meinhardsimonia xiamenensis]
MPRGGSAVMAHRGPDVAGLDDFPTPPWAGRALCEWLLRQGHDLAQQRCREPAAGRGDLARALGEYFGTVEQIDVHDYGAGNLDAVEDYLSQWHLRWVDWTVTNPPFRLAESFIWIALSTSRRGVAMLVRTQFLEGVGRWERLYSVHPPSAVLQFAERVPMLRGRLDRRGSTATAYCWLVWDFEAQVRAGGTRLCWLPPCREALDRAGDWP